MNIQGLSDPTRITPASSTHQQVREAAAGEGAQTVAAAGKPSGSVDSGDLNRVLDRMNRVVRALNYSIKFEVFEGHRIQIKVIDTEKQEVVREIPPEALLEAAQRLDEFLGLLFDKRV